MPDETMEMIEEIEEKTYTVTLSDGTVLSNLKLNGNNFISTEPISAYIFEDNCEGVAISDGEYDETHSHMTPIYGVQQHGNEYWFALRDLTRDELERMKIQADIEYIAMMTDIEL